MPRYFVVPGPIAVKLDEEKTKHVAFIDYVLESLGAEPRVVPTFKAMRQLDALLHELAERKPGDIVAIDEEFWALCKGGIEAPTGSYNFRYARQILPFLETFLNAGTDKKALEKKAAPAAEDKPAPADLNGALPEEAPAAAH